MKIVTQIRNVLNMVLGALVSFVVLVLVLVVCWRVIIRLGGSYITLSLAWTEELSTSLMMWVGILGGAMAYGSKAHLGIDFFVEKLPKSLQRINEIFVTLVILIFNLSVMCWGGYLLVNDCFDLEQTTAALHINRGYIYLSLPVAGGFVIVYSLLILAENILSFFSSTTGNNKSVESAGVK